MPGLRSKFFAERGKNSQMYCVCTSRIFNEVMQKICRKTGIERLCGHVLKKIPEYLLIFAELCGIMDEKGFNTKKR